MRDHARDASATQLLENRKRRNADDSVKANAGTRNDMLDREDMAIVNNDDMELERLAEWHLESSEKRRRRADAEGSGASSSKDVMFVNNETQDSGQNSPPGLRD